MKRILKKESLIFIFLLAIVIFLRFYQLENRMVFGWDQVDNAWAAKNILIDHKFPLVGMVAKQNSGIYIGPLYYYFICIVYFLTNLDPIASGIIAGITGVLTFLVLYFVVKDIFSRKIALVVVLINIFSFNEILFELVQWPVTFIPIISLIFLYCLYKILIGEIKYFIYLGIVLGLSFHIHFTSIFYPIILIFCLPFYPRTKQALVYIFLGGLCSLILLVPTVTVFLQKNYANNAIHYGQDYYHGFHFRRFLQLAQDAVIQFSPFLQFEIAKLFKFFYLPLFSILFIKSCKSKNGLKLIYLFWLWFLVPWLVFTTYRGEISDYYFAVNRPLVPIVLGFLFFKLYEIRIIFFKFLAIGLICFYVGFNLYLFFTFIPYRPLHYNREIVLDKIKKGEKIEFTQGDSQSYLYYFYTNVNTKRF